MIPLPRSSRITSSLVSSHQAFWNHHVLKAATVSSPPANLPKWRRSNVNSLVGYSTVRASAAMIQDYFDELRVIDRVAAGEITLYWKRWEPVKDAATKGLPPDLTEVVLRYLWQDALIQFESHHYCTSEGDI